jgi:FkbM family methyltransferase
MPAPSDYDRLIPPEIKDDPFYAAIHELARTARLKTVLEIGSSSGEGSTEAFVRGLRENPHRPTLFCMEIARPRFEALRGRYAGDAFVKAYNVSSVPPERFPTEAEATAFYSQHLTGRFVPLPEFLRWLRQDLDYIRTSGVPTDGIARIKRENAIEHFDLVLIDGSEFTGKAELDEVYGARFILLDDVNSFKNFENFARLSADANYLLRELRRDVRGGYAIFEQVYRDRPASIPHEAAERRLVTSRVRPGMTVFDVGANLGDYAILLSRLVRKGGRVFAFEPASTTAAKLRQRLAEHGCDNATVFENAVYSHAGPLTFNEFPEEFSVWNSLGKPQMAHPADPSKRVPIVKSETVQAVRLDDVCREHGVRRIDFLKLDVEGAEADALAGAVELLSRKAIRVIQFEVSRAMLDGMNRTARGVFDVLARHGYECRRIERDGSAGAVVTDSDSFYENYVAWPRLCVHFFTLVLNGEPFIRHHVGQFRRLDFDWHWHVVEGVAELRHDTAWSLAAGGRIPADAHRDGRSVDGTSEYLDQLARDDPDRVTVYRKPSGHFWDGKLEMVNRPLDAIAEDCLLWEIDADELWTAGQLTTARQLFLDHPTKTAAFYWCWYFVGPGLVTATRHTYANNPRMEWLRTWRYRPGMRWARHEPPVLAEPVAGGGWRGVAQVDPFTHAQTEAAGLVFQHYAYATEPQVRFKQDYYGYAGAVERWRALQRVAHFPVALRDYFPWVQDETTVDRDEHYVARRLIELPGADAQARRTAEGAHAKPLIVVDGVFFQMYQTGIARVWTELLKAWVAAGLGEHVVVLDRANTAPRIDGVRYRTIGPHDYAQLDADRRMLQAFCDAEGAGAFVSTYYTTPVTTPSLFVAHDMIPERFGWDVAHPMWREKHDAIRRAAGFVAVSEATRRDLLKFFPDVTADRVHVTPLAAAAEFHPRPRAEVDALRAAAGLAKPYFLTVGARGGYKNTALTFRALAAVGGLDDVDVLCAGHVTLEPEFQQLIPGKAVKSFHLTDEQLAAAYSGAIALLHPSTCEGFGLPVLEALACGCPVITTRNGSLPEVAGDAALYVLADDVAAMVDALREVRSPETRQRLAAAGLAHAAKFSWQKTAAAIWDQLVGISKRSLSAMASN